MKIELSQASKYYARSTFLRELAKPMPAKVILRIVSGVMAGQEFVFDQRDCCFAGRGTDCIVRIPGTVDRLISRRHCMLDINPPDIRIRDYGSLNGTWINDSLIGWRDESKSIDEAAQIAKANFSDHDLVDGDRLKLGSTIFDVSIEPGIVCYDCGAEIVSDGQQTATVQPETKRCPNCRSLAPLGRNTTIPLGKRGCSRCNREVIEQSSADRSGQYICQACRDEPSMVVSDLLEKAQAGSRELHAIRGYTLHRELGRGGMGAVFLARHDDSGQDVALKVMLPQVAANEFGKQTFLREVENTKVMRHANIVSLIDHGCDDGVFFFTLQFCNGGSVQQLIDRSGGKLDFEVALRITTQVLRGLDYAHNVQLQTRLSDGDLIASIGLVHRDLKPQNIFLDDSGGEIIAKVGDFGLSKAFDTAGLSGHTRCGTIAGTPVFMPRQQVINFRYPKPDVDVWAAAACLYYMLTGHCPRQFDSHHDVWQTVLTTDAVPIRKRNSSIPRRLAKVIDHALQDKPRIGFQSAAELRHALAKIVPQAGS